MLDDVNADTFKDVAGFDSYKAFDPLPWHNPGYFAGQWWFEFPNGWGASVVRHGGSYGIDHGLFELAVMKDGRLNYTTDITSDVEGRLSQAEVRSMLARVAALDAEGRENVIDVEVSGLAPMLTAGDPGDAPALAS